MNILVKCKIREHECKGVVEDALEMVEWAVNQVELHDFIEHARFAQTDRDGKWHLDRFLSGDERGTGSDRALNFEIIFVDLQSGTAAVTYPDRNIVVLNTRFMDRSLPEICNTLVHEYCHLVGMTHSLEFPGWGIWYRSAPYSIGMKVERMVAREFGIRVGWCRRLRYWIRYWLF